MKKLNLALIIGAIAFLSSTQAEAAGYLCEAICYTRDGGNEHVQTRKPAWTVFGARWSLDMQCDGRIEHPRCFYSYGNSGHDGH